MPSWVIYILRVFYAQFLRAKAPIRWGWAQFRGQLAPFSFNGASQNKKWQRRAYWWEKRKLHNILQHPSAIFTGSLRMIKKFDIPGFPCHAIAPYIKWPKIQAKIQESAVFHTWDIHDQRNDLPKFIELCMKIPRWYPIPIRMGINMAGWKPTETSVTGFATKAWIHLLRTELINSKIILSLIQ